MASFHRTTLELLGTQPRTLTAALGEVERTERRLGMRLPPSVREWYSYDGALPILALHSNGDPPIPVEEFSLRDCPISVIKLHDDSGTRAPHPRAGGV